MFQSVIGDITSMEICATVYQGESIRLEEFSIGGVEKKSGRKDKTAYNIESCDCPLGYDGRWVND